MYKFMYVYTYIYTHTLTLCKFRWHTSAPMKPGEVRATFRLGVYLYRGVRSYRCVSVGGSGTRVGVRWVCVSVWVHERVGVLVRGLKLEVV